MKRLITNIIDSFEYLRDSWVHSETFDFFRSALPLMVWAVILFLCILGIAARTTYESPQTRHELHQAWQRANGATLEFEDWEKLRDANLLPGQRNAESYPVVIPMPMPR